jgi:hypothetical protein
VTTALLGMKGAMPSRLPKLLNIVDKMLQVKNTAFHGEPGRDVL